MSELTGFMRPCEYCNGTGVSVDSDGYLKNCRVCDGTGIHQAILVELSPVVASEPGATVERLEDWTNSQQRALLKASSQATVFCGTYGEANRNSCLALTERGLMQHVTINTFEITKRGAALVADYQRRQGEAQSLEYMAEQNYNMGAKLDNSRRESQDLQRRLNEAQETVARLEAENAVLKETVHDLHDENNELWVFVIWLNSTFDFENGFTEGTFPASKIIAKRLRELIGD